MDSSVVGSVVVQFVCVALVGCARAPEPQVESPAEYCERATALLTAPVADTAYAAALPILYSCPTQAGSVIARLWASPPGEDRDLRTLVFVAGHIHDGRIYEAVRAVATDTTRPRRERVAALFTLVSHYNPSSERWRAGAVSWSASRTDRGRL
jgi:hypothetical protein